MNDPSDARTAREIQTGVLPTDLDGPIRGTGMDLHAVQDPAPEAGGDLYDVVRTADGRLVVAVGDVSGKGTQAAEFMAATVTLFREAAGRFGGPDAIVRAVSDALAGQNPHQLFVTLFCAVFDLNAGSATYASAGHPPPVLIRPGRHPAPAFGSTAMMAGLFPDMPIDPMPLDLRPGDTLVVYTDGVTDAFNAAGEAFGERGLLAHLAAAPGGTAAETGSGVRAAVRGHVGSEPLSDDVVVLAIRRAPAGGAR